MTVISGNTHTLPTTDFLAALKAHHLQQQLGFSGLLNTLSTDTLDLITQQTQTPATAQTELAVFTPQEQHCLNRIGHTLDRWLSSLKEPNNITEQDIQRFGQQLQGLNQPSDGNSVKFGHILNFEDGYSFEPMINPNYPYETIPPAQTPQQKHPVEELFNKLVSFAPEPSAQTTQQATQQWEAKIKGFTQQLNDAHANIQQDFSTALGQKLDTISKRLNHLEKNTLGSSSSVTEIQKTLPDQLDTLTHSPPGRFRKPLSLEDNLSQTLQQLQAQHWNSLDGSDQFKQALKDRQPISGDQDTINDAVAQMKAELSASIKQLEKATNQNELKEGFTALKTAWSNAAKQCKNNLVGAAPTANVTQAQSLLQHYDKEGPFDSSNPKIDIDSILKGYERLFKLKPKDSQSISDRKNDVLEAMAKATGRLTDNHQLNLPSVTALFKADQAGAQANTAAAPSAARWLISSTLGLAGTLGLQYFNLPPSAQMRISTEICAAIPKAVGTGKLATAFTNMVCGYHPQLAKIGLKVGDAAVKTSGMLDHLAFHASAISHLTRAATAVFTVSVGVLGWMARRAGGFRGQ